MAYGERLKNPGADEVPNGRQSYNGAINQVKGNLKWSLTFLSTEEIIDLLVQVQATDNDIVELQKKIEYHNSRIDRLQEKIELLGYENQESCDGEVDESLF